MSVRLKTAFDRMNLKFPHGEEKIRRLIPFASFRKHCSLVVFSAERLNLYLDRDDGAGGGAPAPEGEGDAAGQTETTPKKSALKRFKQVFLLHLFILLRKT